MCEIPEIIPNDRINKIVVKRIVFKWFHFNKVN